MRGRKTLQVSLYLFATYCFFNLLLTAKAILGVKEISSALDLLNLDYLFIVRFVKVFIDFKYSVPMLLWQWFNLLSIGTVLFLGIMFFIVLPEIQRKFKWYLLLIPLQFVLILGGVGWSLNSYNINASLQLIQILGTLIFIVSGLGLLSSLMVILGILSEFIDVSVTIDYNDHKE